MQARMKNPAHSRRRGAEHPGASRAPRTQSEEKKERLRSAGQPGFRPDRQSAKSEQNTVRRILASGEISYPNWSRL
jgi:hypothetical protein